MFLLERLKKYFPVRLQLPIRQTIHWACSHQKKAAQGSIKLWMSFQLKSMFHNDGAGGLS